MNKIPTSNARALPALDLLLRAPALAPTLARWGRLRVKVAASRELEHARAHLRNEPHAVAPSLEALAEAVIQQLDGSTARPLGAVLNLTGTLIHTNLGRAQLPASVASAVTAAAIHAVNLEYDLASGERGDRNAEAAALLCALTGAEAATVLNNNAAALLLALNTLADGRVVPVARGELIEIGGSFRLPEIMAKSGALLREVGTTNRTHLRDYAGALESGAAMLLRVHPSNYAISGFTHQESDADLAALARSHGVPYVVDLGSGALIDLRRYGVPPEPMPQQVLQAGADLVLFSGDKLLGGPQAGLIVGRADLIHRLDANPLKRALRQDKLGLAALCAVLRLYGDPDRLQRELPLLRHLARDTAELARTGAALCAALAPAFAPAFDLNVCASEAQIGSGAQPSARIPSMALTLAPNAAGGGGNRELQQLAKALRALNPPVLGRIHDGRLLLDLRTLDTPDLLQSALLAAAHALRNAST